MSANKRNRPMCRKCGWAMGGPDSWNGKACKCGKAAPPMIRCSKCGGFGTVPYNLGSQPCPRCDGSGLVDHDHAIQAAEGE